MAYENILFGSNVAVQLFCGVFGMGMGDGTHRKRTGRAAHQQGVTMQGFSSQLSGGESWREECGLAFREVLAVLC